MEIVLNSVKYKVVKNERDAIDVNELEEKMTDYFFQFDTILGDYAYGKLRLKGFNKRENKNFKPYNDEAKLRDYIEKYCAYGCRHFVITKA